MSGDHEPSIKALQEEVRRTGEEEALVQNSPVDSSANNGSVEKAVQEVEGTIRTHKIPHWETDSGWRGQFCMAS